MQTISYDNNFTGELPSEYFRSWNAMKVFDSSNSYLKTKSSFKAVQRTWTLEYTYSTTITIKGTKVHGSIPPSLGNITRVESLDLLQNELSGEIPQQLVELTFLAFFNLSHNCLTGRIPRGNQLNTFENSSYMGNSGLCGDPLTKKCDVFVGYGIGVVVGVVIENTVKGKKRDLWLGIASYSWRREPAAAARINNDEETLELEF
ncbi:LRR domain containing protein [Trema orientale]|uniref:LRR domain containing protein n=1 Tax=Trema orientale TaxID=63057 RepID=A0A2P5ESF9_TREOI|nr:LRR domain containing protein [Trema orientale]